MPARVLLSRRNGGIEVRYEEAVAEGRRLVKRSEKDRWKLALLSWEQSSAVGQERWAQDIGVSQQQVSIYVRIAKKYYQVVETDRPLFSDAEAEAKGMPLERSERREREALANIRKATPKRKAEIARELLAEPEVADKLAIDGEATRALDQAFMRTRKMPEKELRKAYERVPEELRNESLGAPTGVSQYLSGIREYLRLIHELATNPRVAWEGYRGAVAEELHRISRQAEGIAEVIEDPKRAQVSDEELERLLREAR